MRMKIAWLQTLIFCTTLALVAAGLDLGPIIKTAQCRSMCLRYHMINDNCWKKNKTDNQINDCDEVIKNVLHCRVFYDLQRIFGDTPRKRARESLNRRKIPNTSHFQPSWNNWVASKTEIITWESKNEII